MKGRLKHVAVLATVLSLGASAAAASVVQTRLSPADIGALAKGSAGPGTSGVNGIRTTILYGDPARPGPYTIEIRVPPHTRIAAHTHRDDRIGMVVSGRWFFGYGATLTERRVKSLPPGSFYTEPAGAPHFALTRNEPAVVYITGQGPSDTRFTKIR